MKRMLIIYTNNAGGHFLLPKEDVPVTTAANCIEMGFKLAPRRAVPDSLHNANFTSIDAAKKAAAGRGYEAVTVQWLTWRKRKRSVRQTG